MTQLVKVTAGQLCAQARFQLGDLSVCKADGKECILQVCTIKCKWLRAYSASTHTIMQMVSGMYYKYSHYNATGKTCIYKYTQYNSADECIRIHDMQLVISTHGVL